MMGVLLSFFCRLIQACADHELLRASFERLCCSVPFRWDGAIANAWVSRTSRLCILVLRGCAHMWLFALLSEVVMISAMRLMARSICAFAFATPTCTFAWSAVGASFSTCAICCALW